MSASPFRNDVKSTSQSNFNGFLSLPPEIRLMVYGEIAIPDTTPLASYKGLYLSCRQVKTKMDDEVVKKIRQYLKDTEASFAKESSLSNLQLVLPSTFSEVAHLNITTPHSVWLSFTYLSFFSILKSWMPLLCLHLESITFRLASGTPAGTTPGMVRHPHGAWVIDALRKSIQGENGWNMRHVCVILDTETSQITWTSLRLMSRVRGWSWEWDFGDQDGDGEDRMIFNRSRQTLSIS